MPIHDIELNEYCEKSINMGTEDKPKYSCEKCDYSNTNSLVRITFESNNTVFCEKIPDYNTYLANCSEAIKLEEDSKKYNCTKCFEGSLLTYDKNTDTYYCKYNSQKCEVKYCKKCQKDNNNFCEECSFHNYEPDLITGSCVKKLRIYLRYIGKIYMI
jgi:hypothetical protein